MRDLVELCKLCKDLGQHKFYHQSHTASASTQGGILEYSQSVETKQT